MKLATAVRITISSTPVNFAPTTALAVEPLRCRRTDHLASPRLHCAAKERRLRRNGASQRRERARHLSLVCGLPPLLARGWRLPDLITNRPIFWQDPTKRWRHYRIIDRVAIKRWRTKLPDPDKVAAIKQAVWELEVELLEAIDPGFRAALGEFIEQDFSDIRTFDNAMHDQH